MMKKFLKACVIAVALCGAAGAVSYAAGTARGIEQSGMYLSHCHGGGHHYDYAPGWHGGYCG